MLWGAKVNLQGLVGLLPSYNHKVYSARECYQPGMTVSNDVDGQCSTTA